MSSATFSTIRHIVQNFYLQIPQDIQRPIIHENISAKKSCSSVKFINLIAEFIYITLEYKKNSYQEKISYLNKILIKSEPTKWKYISVPTYNNHIRSEYTCVSKVFLCLI